MRYSPFIYKCVGFVCLIGVGFFVYTFSRSHTSPSTYTIPIDALKVQRPVPSGLKEYRNDQYGFSVLYPKDLEVMERFGIEKAITVTFQNIKEQKGFQIFIVPYTEDQISEERFKKDIPSGVRKKLENITIDNVLAAAFYSTDQYLGDMREVWFIHNGFLYEVSTIKSYEKTLSDILLTWMFVDIL